MAGRQGCRQAGSKARKRTAAGHVPLATSRHLPNFTLRLAATQCQLPCLGCCGCSLLTTQICQPSRFR